MKRIDIEQHLSDATDCMMTSLMNDSSFPYESGKVRWLTPFRTFSVPYGMEDEVHFMHWICLETGEHLISTASKDDYERYPSFGSYPSLLGYMQRFRYYFNDVNSKNYLSYLLECDKGKSFDVVNEEMYAYSFICYHHNGYTYMTHVYVDIVDNITETIPMTRIDISHIYVNQTIKAEKGMDVYFTQGNPDTEYYVDPDGVCHVFKPDYNMKWEIEVGEELKDYSSLDGIGYEITRPRPENVVFMDGGHLYEARVVTSLLENDPTSMLARICGVTPVKSKGIAPKARFNKLLPKILPAEEFWQESGIVDCNMASCFLALVHYSDSKIMNEIGYIGKMVNYLKPFSIKYRLNPDNLDEVEIEAIPHGSLELNG